MEDPFAEAIENNVTAPVVSEPPEVKQVVKADGSHAGISVTFKFKGEYADPWVVIHADTVADAVDVTKDADFKDLMDRTRVIANKYGPAGNTPAPATSQNASQSRSQGRGNSGPRKPAGPPPGLTPLFCDHGEMKYITGTGKKGAWAAWGCPTREGDCWEFIND